MAALDDLKAFDLANSSASLWVFKGPTGPVGHPPNYTGRWVETDDAVDVALKEVVNAERQRIEETIVYELLAQNNEASALTIPLDETNAGVVLDAAAAEIPDKRVSKSAHLLNSKFYVIKLVHKDVVIFAIRQAGGGWKTKRSLSVRSLLYEENRLTLDERPHFDIEKSIDFFIVGNEVLILNKSRFESILRYREADQNDFIGLQTEAEFTGVFVDIAPLIAHVGQNKIQLRRVSAIRQKGNYRDQNFMTRLRDTSAQYGFTFQFDGDGKIVVTPETCAQIMTALLDYRLASGFSARVYDVPSATQIAV